VAVWVALQETLDEYGAHLLPNQKTKESKMLRIFWFVYGFSPVD